MLALQAPRRWQYDSWRTLRGSFFVFRTNVALTLEVRVSIFSANWHHISFPQQIMELTTFAHLWTRRDDTDLFPFCFVIKAILSCLLSEKNSPFVSILLHNYYLIFVSSNTSRLVRFGSPIYGTTWKYFFAKLKCLPYLLTSKTA